jgi:regulator of sirC expression with transglutaminase-like and TPR domain
MTQVLKSDPACGKALCRRGQAYIALQRFDEARADLSRAQELCPGETEYLRGQLEALRKKEEECKRREAAMCRNMFSA